MNVEGKWKLNQNHPDERRAKVVAALSQRSDEDSQAIAELMRTSLRDATAREVP
jgi:transcriptional regulator